MDRTSILFRRGKSPEEGGYPGHGHRTIRENGMVIERDVAVPMRDGARIFVDIYRPDGAGDLPALVGWSPYGKHPHIKWDLFPGSGVEPGALSPYTPFEAPDPVAWTTYGYAVVFPDPRGTWYSEGEEATFFSPQESQDAYDLIEWLAGQEWSSGKVGMAGVSYLAMMQWLVAARRPPHLAAINPWEGCSDLYREFFFHAGIPSTRFVRNWESRIAHSRGPIEDVRPMMDRHPLFDEYWAEKNAALERIEVPAYIVASWTDHGLHTRGTLEAFQRISSRDKWLEIHGRKKWQHYYAPESVERQRLFFDRFLKGREEALNGWPKVRLEVRERFGVGALRDEQDWPVARRELRPLFLDGRTSALTPRAPEEVSEVRYDPRDPTRGAQFDYLFDEATEITGNIKLKLWVRAEHARDMDLFAVLQKLDVRGERVPFAHFNAFEDGDMAYGWLRVSHRELDPERSTPDQPYLSHRRELPLPEDGEPVAVEIEVWPTSTRFAAGETLRLVVQGGDIRTYPEPLVAIAHESTRNEGIHVLLSGGGFDAHLLVPVVAST